MVVGQSQKGDSEIAEMEIRTDGILGLFLVCIQGGEDDGNTLRQWVHDLAGQQIMDVHVSIENCRSFSRSREIFSWVGPGQLTYSPFRLSLQIFVERCTAVCTKGPFFCLFIFLFLN